MGAGTITSPPVTSVNANKWFESAKLNAFHVKLFSLGFGVFTIDGYDLVIYGAAIPLLMKAFSMGPAKTGAIAGYALIGNAIGSFFIGPLADKIGRKNTVILCAALFSVCMGLTGFTTSPLTLGILRFLTGLGIGGSMPSIISICSEYSPSRNRTIMGGGITGGVMIGGILAALFSLWLFPPFGWRSVFFMGALPLIFIPFLVKFLPESPDHLLKNKRTAELRAFMRRARPADSLPDSATIEVNKVSSKVPVAATFQDGRAFSSVMLWIMAFLNMTVIYGFTIWLPKLMMNAGYSLSKGLFSLVTLQVVSLVGVALFGMIADRIGGRPALVMAFLFAFVCIALMPYIHNYALLSLLVGLSGFGFSGGQSVIAGYIGSYYPPAIRSTGVGLAYGVSRCGGFFGPVYMGILLSIHCSYQTSMLLLAAPAIGAVICILLVRDKYSYGRQQQDSQRQESTAVHA